MRRAPWLGLACSALGRAPGLESAAAVARAPAPRRGSGLNVLLITIDTLRADHLGIYGYRRKTSPRIDALAAGGDGLRRRPTRSGPRRAAASS